MLTERIVNIILTNNIQPENILISTFTAKAAKEILTRISNKILEHDLKLNVNDFYTGTLHSIFLRLIDEHLVYSVFKRSYSILDDFDQKYYVYRHVYGIFKKIPELADYIKPKSQWDRASSLIGIFNKFTEENIDVSLLAESTDEELKAYAKAYDYYYLENSIDGLKLILECVNKYNEILHDTIIPKLFNHLWDLEEKQTSYEEEIALVNEPPEGKDGFKCVTTTLDKVVEEFDFKEKPIKSFHYSPYCFDSNPEMTCFKKAMRDEQEIERVFFTGQLTHGQSDFYISYIDP